MGRYKNDHPTIKFIGLRRILIDKIRELVKDYNNQTNDKTVWEQTAPKGGYKIELKGHDDK